MIAAWGEACAAGRGEIVGIESSTTEHLIAEIRPAARSASGSGVPVEMTLFYLFQFRDGEVVRFHLYGDREAAVAARPAVRAIDCPARCQ